ncbi:MAG: hypothetical protein U9O06_01515 [Euryarchaeota archaeon]|nr:hypothetical protein [Euryarchaeota archaeon]
MQRRAVAVYVAFFVLIAAASYTLLATAEEPTITLENAEYELSQNDTFSVGGQQYTVTSIEESEDGSGSGTLEWTETDVEMTETWANESTVEIGGTEWTVLIEGDAANATSFTFEEVVDRQAILEDDPDVLNETQEVDGEEYVVDQSSGENDLIPAEEYFGAPATQTASVGDSFTYNDQTVTVDEIGANGVTVAWTQDQTNTIDLAHEGTSELADDNEYLVFFPGDGTVMLTQDTSSYDAQVEAQQEFSERQTGFRWTTFTSLLFALSLIAFAFLPSRY